MLAHNLKEILSIVPDAKELIKQANIEEDFPLDNKDGAIASCLRAYYLIKIANKNVDLEVMEKLEKAASLYGIQEITKPLIHAMKRYAETTEKNMIKSAEVLPVKVAEANFEGSLTGFFDIEKAAVEAAHLMEKYSTAITSKEIKRYVGNAYFNKFAAIQALEARASFTGRDIFTKMASVIEKNMEYDSSQREILDVCQRITKMDKEAGISAKGFNFYKEALSVNPELDKIGSALMVRVAGKPCPYEKIERLGQRRIGQYLGKDVSEQMTQDPILNKRIIESLPLDLQRVLANLLKNV